MRCFKIPISCFLHCKWRLTAVQISIVYLKSICIECFLFSKWWNVYLVSIISSDCTLKIPTKGNQTKLFFLYENVLHPCSIFNHDSVLYWNVWVYFLQQLGVFYLAVARLLSAGERCAAASDLPAESVAAFVDWNICWTTRGGRRRGAVHSKHWYKPDEAQIHWPFWFGVRPGGFSHRSNRSETTMIRHNKVHIWAIRSYSTRLSEKTTTNCKKGFLCSRSTTHQRHCIPGFSIKALEVVVFVVYLLLAVNNCVKNAFNVYSKVRRALGMQRECCDPFLHSVCGFCILSCAILQGWGGLHVYEDAENDGRWGTNWTRLMDRRAFIRSWNVVLMCCVGDHRRARSVSVLTCYIKNDDNVLHTGASKIFGV